MKRRELLAALALPATLPTTVPAQTPRPAPMPRGATLLSGATVHPVSSAALQGGQVLLAAERILAVLPEGAALPELPAGMALQRIALSADQHLYPGLVAANTQLGLVENPTLRATLDAEEIGSLNPNALAATAFHADSELVGVARAGGVLTAEVAPLSPRGGLLAGRSGVLQLDGWAWPDMALRSPHALHLHLPPTEAASSLLSGAGTAPPASAVQQRLRQLDEAFERAKAYAAARAVDASRPRDLRLEALAPYARGEAPVVVHVPEPAQVRQALDLRRRHDLRLVLVGRSALLPFAALLRDAGVGLLINGVQELPARRDDPVDAVGSLPAQLHAAGLRFAIAREAGLSNAHNLRNLAHEAGAAVAHGLPAEVALRAITLDAAELLGVADQLGSLQVGKLATLIVSSGDVMEPASRVLRAWVRGREIDLRNRQTRLTEKYRQP